MVLFQQRRSWCAVGIEADADLPSLLAHLVRRAAELVGARFAALGVLDDYRRRGVTELLILNTLINGTKYGNFNAAELGWTLEDNSFCCNEHCSN